MALESVERHRLRNQTSLGGLMALNTGRGKSSAYDPLDSRINSRLAKVVVGLLSLCKIIFKHQTGSIDPHRLSKGPMSDARHLQFYYSLWFY